MGQTRVKPESNKRQAISRATEQKVCNTKTFWIVLYQAWFFLTILSFFFLPILLCSSSPCYFGGSLVQRRTVNWIDILHCSMQQHYNELPVELHASCHCHALFSRGFMFRVKTASSPSWTVVYWYCYFPPRVLQLCYGCISVGMNNAFIPV